MAGKPLFLVVGILLLFVAALAFLAVLGSLAGTPSNPPDVGLATFSAVCGTLLGLIGLGLVFFYRQGARYAARLETIVAVLDHVTEARVEDLARTIDATPAETMALITEAIQFGRISGYLEPRDGRFVRTVPGSQRTPAPWQPSFCRECGSHLERSSDASGFLCPNCGHREPA